MKTLRLPLPRQTWSGLRADAERAQVPATALAREAIDCWLRKQTKRARHDQVAAWAAEMAGTDLDLDPDLGAAGIEQLVHAIKGTLSPQVLGAVGEALKASMDLD